MKNKSLFTLGQFVAWDGEGGTSLVSGKHEYMLLMSSKGHQLFNPNGISTKQALQFLTESSTSLPMKSINVMFAGSYDANMMLKDLPRKNAILLWEYGDTWWEGYHIRFRQRKYFEIARYGGVNKVTGRTIRTHRIIIWDVFGFFQSSFVDAIKNWLGDDWPTLSQIVRGKERRSDFQANEMLDFVASYTKCEVDALVQIMNVLKSSLLNAGLVISRWDGAGAVATKLMLNNKVKQYLPLDRKNMGKSHPRQKSVQHAYAGGRFELLQFGCSNDRVYEADINSAYPNAIRYLPDLSKDLWNLESWGHNYLFAVHPVRWKLKKGVGSRLHPFFYRTEASRVLFPPIGNGYYWVPEIKAALDCASDIYDFEIGEGWVYHDDGTRPFRNREDMFLKRRIFKEDNNPAEKSIKLGMNSEYGKFAQTVGGKKGNPPPFHCLEYAGWITSYTRAMLYRAAMQCPEKIIMLATDGIYSLQPLTLDYGNWLGQWEYKEYINGMFVQSGVYWLQKSNGEWIEHRRGYDPGSLIREEILHAWAKGKKEYPGKTTRFLTLGSIKIGEARWSEWCTWKTTDRMLSLYPDDDDGKRVGPSGRVYPNNGLIVTRSSQVFNPSIVSKPHNVPWLDQEDNTLQPYQAKLFIEGEHSDTWC